MKLLIIITLLMCLDLNSFPGEHNSLTCDKHYLDLNLKETVKIGSRSETILTEELLNLYNRRYRSNLIKNSDSFQSYTIIMNSIKDD